MVTSLMPYRWARPVHSLTHSVHFVHFSKAISVSSSLGCDLGESDPIFCFLEVMSVLP